jgi:hypothetical protein
VLPFQVAVTLLALIVASGFALLRGGATIISYHIIFAIGVVPLILGAIIHFVPVLTRSKNPGKFIRALPAIALFGGVMVTMYFAFPQTLPYGYTLGASIIIITIVSLVVWAYRLRIKTIGNPHPCLNWYLAALICLLIALSAILVGYFIPSQRATLRLLHLHLNTLGFISITALGTLQVLMPTVAQRPDLHAATRMGKHFKWVVAGTFIIAFGAAWHLMLTYSGVVLLATPIFFILKSWIQLYSKEIFRIHGAAPTLAVAFCGYVIALIIGTIHGYHQLHLNPIATFIIAFIMPLVIGAVSYLLPLWLHPGQQTPWHLTARKHLGYFGSLRALILMAAGIIVGLGYEAGWYLAVFATGTFAIQTLAIFIRKTNI